MTWTLTNTGKKFDYLEWDSSQVCLEDIAHALSFQCRYNGHCHAFYCVTPDTKILTKDLRWVTAGTLRCGDELLGFDEEAVGKGPNKKPRRRIKPSVVLHDGLIKRNVYRLYLSDGSSVKASEEHPWLVSSKLSKNSRWETVKQIVDGVDSGRKRWLLRYFTPWSSTRDYDSGYLSGLLDGEAHLASSGGGLGLYFSQNAGQVLDRARELFHDKNYRTLEYRSTLKVKCMKIGCSWVNTVKALGELRPLRLLTNFMNWLDSGKFNSTLTDAVQVEVIGYDYLGEQDVVALETSSRTYFANGFAAHNSTAEHSMHLADHIARKYRDDKNRKKVNRLVAQALLHDAAEAYVGDMPGPFKHDVMKDFNEYEHNLMSNIFEKYKLPRKLYKEVHDIDCRILINEKQALFPKDGVRWPMEDTVKPLEDLKIMCFTPMDIYPAFLQALKIATERL